MMTNRQEQENATLLQNRILNNYNTKVKGEKSIKNNYSYSNLTIMLVPLSSRGYRETKVTAMRRAL